MDGIPGVEGDFLTRVYFEDADGTAFNQSVTPDEELTRGLASPSGQLPDPPSIGDLDAAGLPPPSFFDHSGNQGRGQRDVRKKSYEKFKQKKAAGKIDIANAGKIRKGHESRKQTADKRPREGGDLLKQGKK